MKKEKVAMTSIKQKNYWALILGASSGMGLASAKKLASLGFNIVAVHRDRKGSMAKIDQEFESIRQMGVKLHAMNTNALTAEGRKEVIQSLFDVMNGGTIRTVLHSIALGNLKLVAPYHPKQTSTLANLAEKTGVAVETLQKSIDELFASGEHDLINLASAPNYSNDQLLGEEDFQQTIYNMGTSLLFWVQELHAAGVLAADARVLGLTSEGNSIAWRGYGAVAAAKCALESVARTIAVEFAPYGIRCNILQPGVTDTPALRLIPGSLRMLAGARLRNPFGRTTTPEDVAGVVALMSMDEAAWINGALIRVDGGEHIAG
jgi:NAD(P)-dependent dehydrogenase (short-subunit alcohol dehydrogenase family)